KSAGKRQLTDNNPEMCWISRQGPGQYIYLTFERLAIPKRITVIFQGGFVGTKCTDSKCSSHVDIYPPRANKRQIFDLITHRDGLPVKGIQSMKLVFEESSGFYGRITIYELKIEGLLL
ncbi:hypothetical protein DFH29DRAFT_803091, partial [Suillus ampliporus]